MHLAQVGYDTIRAAVKKICGVRAIPDANRKAKATRTSRSDANRRILENRSPLWQHAETARRLQEHIRRRFSGEA
jgi:hypothetical protein